MHPSRCSRFLRFLRFLPLLSLCLLAPPAFAQDGGGGSPLDDIVGAARKKIVEAMKAEAETVGVKISSVPTFHEADGSIAAFAPVDGIENLTPDDLAKGVTLGLLMASGPKGAEAPSGAFRVWAQASGGKGKFAIIDHEGNTVQEGDLEVEANEGAAAARGLSNGSTFSSFLPNYCKAWPFWPYPYFVVYPWYQWGCTTYTYCWPWGCFRARYCWWPWCSWYGRCLYYPGPFGY